jgi:hypothetical protein
MKVIKITASALVVVALLAITLSANGCSRASKSNLPYVPVGYYTCIEVQADELVGAYFDGDWGNLDAAAKAYNNLPFIFKNIKVSSYMLSDEANDIFNISTIRCTPLISGTVSAIKIGETIDIVGVNRGVLADYDGWLRFTDCIFLPAGSVNLPAPGAATFVQIY